jgi:hypothetical protein
LFAKKIKDLYKGATVYVALETANSGVTLEMIEGLDARVLFGGERRMQLWAGTIESGQVAFETWDYEVVQESLDLASAPIDALLPVALRRGGKLEPVSSASRLRKSDRVRLLIAEARRDAAHEWLREHGFVPISGRVTDTTNQKIAGGAS